MMNRRYNLVDEPWVPVADVGRVSLQQIFSESSYRTLGGNPVQKIAVTKLLLAIAQAAHTPANEEDWANLGAAGMAKKCLSYLDKWHDRFWLYGDKPFLQIPAIVDAETRTFGDVLPEVSTGNTTVLIQSQVGGDMSDADRTMLLLVLMGFSLGGKKVDNKVVLTPGYKGKTNDKDRPSSGKPGSSLGFNGYMHNYLVAEHLAESLWLNIFTAEQIEKLGIYNEGLGAAPWEKMPVGEADVIAESLRQSYMGRLIPLGRFCLLNETGLHYSEGISHANYKEGVFDPSTAVYSTQGKHRILWVDPQKRPWRELTSLLSFIDSSRTGGFDCHQIQYSLDRARKQMPVFSIWSGGLRVSNNAGEQYVSGTDDYVESSTILHGESLGDVWYERLKEEMRSLEKIAKHTYGATNRFFKAQQMEGKEQAKRCSNLFWQLCERKFQHLVDSCKDLDTIHKLRREFADFSRQAYNNCCPKETARQLDAWAKNRPNLSKYLEDTRKDTKKEAA